MMNLQTKITIKGLLAKQGVLPQFLVRATAKELCFFWNLCYGCPITDLAKLPQVTLKRWRT